MSATVVGMTVSIEPLHCGTLTAPRSFFEEGARQQAIAIPVPAWLIRHPQGVVLFDTGMSEELSHKSDYLDAVSALFQVGCSPSNLIGARLADHEIDAADVDLVVLSHLHFDHVGGLREIPDARLVVHADEWAAGFDDELTRMHNFQRSEFDLGHEVLTVDGPHDVFGDGAITTIPTPGHTPGHQSLLVRLDSGDVVLSADCAYFESTLAGGALPPLCHDREQQAASVARLRAMRSDGATVIPGHDPVTFRTLPDRLL